MLLLFPPLFLWSTRAIIGSLHTISPSFVVVLVNLDSPLANLLHPCGRYFLVYLGIFRARSVIIIPKAFPPHDKIRGCHVAFELILVPNAKELIIMTDHRELSTGYVFDVKAEAEWMAWVGRVQYERCLSCNMFLPYGVPVRFSATKFILSIIPDVHIRNVEQR